MRYDLNADLATVSRLEKNLNLKRGEMHLFSFFYTSLQTHNSFASNVIENEYGVMPVSLYRCLVFRHEVAGLIRLEIEVIVGLNCRYFKNELHSERVIL
jgi:hypothetical protein